MPDSQTNPSRTDVEANAPLEALRENLAITIAEAIRDSDDENEQTLEELGRFVADQILQGAVVHHDVCPECWTPLTWHPLDAPPHHPCKVEREMFVPAAFVGEVR